MTIIRPNKNKYFLKFLFIVLAVIFIGGGFYVFEYNNFVNIRHERNALKKGLTEMQSLNADLKNELFSEIDSANLEGLARNYDLVLEKKPVFLGVQ